MILVVWIALIVLTTFYCYFCEQRLFPASRRKSLEDDTSEEGEPNEDQAKGNLVANMISTLPKDNLRSRKEVRLAHMNGTS